MTTLPLDTAPGPSPDDEAVRNAGICRELLTAAREGLAEGDLLQASEKIWGAAAFAVKAVAEKRRWFNEADWKLRRAAVIIASELADPSLMSRYVHARDAHFNFYRHEYDARMLGMAWAAAAELVAALMPTLAADYQPPYVDETTETAIRSLEQPTSDPDRERMAIGRPPIETRPPLKAAALPIRSS